MLTRTHRWPSSRSIRRSGCRENATTQRRIGYPSGDKDRDRDNVCGGVRRDRVTRPVVALGAALAAFWLLSLPAQAHGFGQRYDLPLPLSLYLLGTAAAVVLSFVIVGF